MMGDQIHDPHHVEGDIETISGLGLLPVTSKLTNDKRTEQCSFNFLKSEVLCKGYEIHMGETMADIPSPLCKIDNGPDDGYFLNPKTWGTYIHGILDNMAVIADIIKIVGGKEPADFNIEEFKEEQYDKLAALVRKNTDMEYIYKTIER